MNRFGPGPPEPPEDATPKPPQRVRVTGPPRRSGPSRAPGAAEIDQQSPLGAILIDSLVASQRRLAAGVLAVVCVGLGVLPLLFRVVPGLADLRVLGLPLPYLVLGVLVHPLLVTLAVFFVRRAEENERAFRDLVDDRRRPTS